MKKRFAEVMDVPKLTSVETHYVYGRRDEYVAQLDNTKGYLRRMQTEIPGLKITSFESGHRIEPEVLKQLVGSPQATP